MRTFPQIFIVFLLLACLVAPSIAEEELELPLLEEEIYQLQEEAEPNNNYYDNGNSVVVPVMEEENTTQEVPNADATSIEEKSDKVEVWLPIIEVQFVCDHDIRAS